MMKGETRMRRRGSRRGLITTLPAALAALAGTAPALAQDGPAAPDPDAQDGEDIVVTARRRSESLQQVPVSATVIDGTAVSDNAILTIQDLTTTLPAVTLAKGSTSNRQFIRGVGSGDNPGFEQSVGTFIDDVYHGRARSSEAGIFDIERVEVLRGPQTTYFGNNAIAGALNIVTRDPGTTLSGEARGSFIPAFDTYSGEAAVDLPIGGTIAVRAAGILTGSDGWIEDSGAGEDVPRNRAGAARGTLLWRPTDGFSARLKAQYTRDRQRGGLPIIRSDCPPGPDFGGPAGFCAAAIALNAGPLSADFARNTSPGQRTDLDSQDYSATFELDRDRFTLTSVTGYSRYDYALDTDLDLTPAFLLTASAPERYRQFSQELRITSAEGGPVEYTAGLYYQHGRLNVANVFTYGFLSGTIAAALPPLAPFLPLAVNDRYRETSDTYSGFGALSWNASDQVRLTGALRYTMVEKDFQQTIVLGTVSPAFAPFVPLPDNVAPLGAAFTRAANLASPGTVALSRNDDAVSASLSGEYDLTPDVMLYARYDRGFKAGGFNGVDFSGDASVLPFAPESVDSLEAGAKVRLSGRGSLNVAFFRAAYHDLQLAGVVPSAAGTYVNRVQNAGGAVSQGIELDVQLRLSRTLRTSVSATLLDAHYTEYPNATPTAFQVSQGIKVQDLEGERTPFAPTLSGSWTVNCDVPVTASLRLGLEARLFGTTGYFLNFNSDPNVRQDGYVRVDLRASLAADQGFEIAVIARNLTDRTIRTYGASLPGSLGTFAYITEPPRHVAFQLSYAF